MAPGRSQKRRNKRAKEKMRQRSSKNQGNFSFGRLIQLKIIGVERKRKHKNIYSFVVGANRFGSWGSVADLVDGFVVRNFVLRNFLSPELFEAFHRPEWLTLLDILFGWSELVQSSPVTAFSGIKFSCTSRCAPTTLRLIVWIRRKLRTTSSRCSGYWNFQSGYCFHFEFSFFSLHFTNSQTFFGIVKTKMQVRLSSFGLLKGKAT